MATRETSNDLFGLIVFNLNLHGLFRLGSLGGHLLDLLLHHGRHRVDHAGQLLRLDPLEVAQHRLVVAAYNTEILLATPSTNCR